MLRGLCIGVVLLLAGAGAALAADPVVPQQDWLARVVPADLPPPTGAIPPIAIIETGYDRSNPDMQGGWIALRRPSPVPDGSDDDRVLDFLEGILHGTAVASVIGAPRDGVGMEGVLPGARVGVYGSTGLCRDVAAAIREAARDGARVINISGGFSRGGVCLALRDATTYAFGHGSLVVASAGNQRSQPWVQPGNDLHILTVGALNAFDQPTGFSHQGLYTDVSAPGEGILTAVPSVLDVGDGVQDGYMRLDGTSFSAPMVSAAAAWIMAERPGLTADQVGEVLRGSARDLQRPGWDISTGWGALDLRAALARTAPATDLYEPNDDIRWVSGRAGLAADPPLLRRRARQTISARLDLQKDTYDVYPVWIPAGATVTVALTPRAIRADLYVWRPSARSAYERSGVVAASRRPGTAPERVAVHNGRPAGATYWVEIRGVRGGDLSGVYSLALRR